MSKKKKKETNIVPIYIKSLEINNLRTFDGKIDLDFEKPDGTLPHWTIILGDNGIGKSTLLQCVAWMKPYLPDIKDESGEKIRKDKIEPAINFESNDSLERLVRKGIDAEKDHTYIKGIFIAGHDIPGAKHGKKDPFCTSLMEIYLDSEQKLKDVHHSFTTNSDEIFLENEINIYAYSASRVLGKTNINDASMNDTLEHFLTDSTVLYDAEEILHTVNYAAFGAKGHEKERYDHYLEKLKDTLRAVLPDIVKTDDITITTPKLVDNQLKSGEVLITTKHGKKIPFRDFSLGYKTVGALVVDISWRLFNQFPENEEPLHEPAIILIDEIDLHLHPVWQKEILVNLTECFPKVQFVATAHSPLIVQAAVDQNYAVLKFQDGGVKVLNEPKGINGWRVDQILTSDFFGLKTSWGIKYEELSEKRERLLRLKKPSKKEKNELEEVTTELAAYPVGETMDEIENRKLISDIVEKIRTDKIKIEL